MPETSHSGKNPGGAEKLQGASFSFGNYTQHQRLGAFPMKMAGTSGPAARPEKQLQAFISKFARKDAARAFVRFDERSERGSQPPTSWSTTTTISS